MGNWTARKLGIVCGLAAAAVGIAYLLAAGAPPRLIALQGAALAIGLVALPIVTILSGLAKRRSADLVLLLFGSLLLATALFGIGVEGAARWVRIGAVQLQTSLILLPPMLLLYSRKSGAAGTVGMILAALALAIQPDRAMAGALAVSLGVLALQRSDRMTLTAALFALAGFIAALAQPDTLPAASFVDQVYYSAFGIHLLLGAAVLAGAASLALPALGRGESGERLVFGSLWLTIALAAALGNYPTPLVGYGGSAVIGYLLSVALLGSAARIGALGRSSDVRRPDGSPDEPLLRSTG
jgi:cell division protein FtsW (lipid II flippase)